MATYSDMAASLREVGYRLTPQRMMILAAIHQSAGHTTAEAIHERVKFVECSRENFKITYPQDMELAKRVHLKRMKEKRVWYA